MKFSNFPYLVQQEILHNMEYSHLFMLSFVSKNLKKFIKSSQITRFKSINSIVYDDIGGNPPWVYIPGRHKPEMILNFSDYCTHENNSFWLDVCGTMIGFNFFGFGFPIIFGCPVAYGGPNEPAIKSIHNYLLDLFGSSVECRCKTSSRAKQLYPRPIWYIPKLQNLSALSISCHGEEESLRKVWSDFSMVPVFKHIDFSFLCLSVVDLHGSIIQRHEFMPKSQKLFPPKCKLYQAESIETTQFYISTPAILSLFQGRQAIVKCVFFEISYLIEFMNRWKSGKAFQKLECLQIEKVEDDGDGRDGDVTDFPQVLDRIGAKYIDETKTPPTHTVPKIHIEFHGANPNTPEIKSHAYVVRESDKRVASVLIQGRVFQFGVWDKTEEEFLRMME
ncbi:hypothetical protein B9Z55_000010 [Caenorhabditis nigoni]|uniref:F-box domain-containing protein n=3 Tax=Caenorhabditis nigoni TaxID=1611254 RepID=A0A2G5VDS1_9PELO|nr:hypothetical protein B9Z55_000010 [Caenorhabditis nigoni]